MSERDNRCAKDFMAYRLHIARHVPDNELFISISEQNSCHTLHQMVHSNSRAKDSSDGQTNLRTLEKINVRVARLRLEKINLLESHFT